MNATALVISIDVERIIVQTDGAGAPINPRGPVLSTVDLQDSIRARGLRQPIEVRPHPEQPNRYYLRHGHRRLTAVKALGWKTVPCTVSQPAVSPEAAPIEDMLDMLAGEVIEEYPPLSVALAVQRLTAAGKTRKEIGEAWGRPADIVSAYVQMLDAHPLVQDALNSGRLKPSVFARIKNWPRDEQEAVMSVAPEGEITMRWIVGQARTRRAAREERPTERVMEPAEQPDTPAVVKSADLRELYGQLLTVVRLIEQAAHEPSAHSDPTLGAMRQEALSVLTRLCAANPEPARVPVAVPDELLF